MVKARYTRFPEDDLSIFATCRDLGSNHPHLIGLLLVLISCTATNSLSVTECLIDNLLHSSYVSGEPRLDDPRFQALLVVIFNAASRNTGILNLLPPIYASHYIVLRERSVPSDNSIARGNKRNEMDDWAL